MLRYLRFGPEIEEDKVSRVLHTGINDLDQFYK